MVAGVGKLGGITTEASLALYQLFLEEYRKKIKGNANNLPVLILKYKDICKQVVDNPDSRLDFYKNEYKKKI